MSYTLISDGGVFYHYLWWGVFYLFLWWAGVKSIHLFKLAKTNALKLKDTLCPNVFSINVNMFRRLGEGLNTIYCMFEDDENFQEFYDIDQVTTKKTFKQLWHKKWEHSNFNTRIFIAHHSCLSHCQLSLLKNISL